MYEPSISSKGTPDRAVKMPGATGTPQTLYDKVLQAHIVDEKLDGTVLLYIDRHLMHEVTSPVSPQPYGSVDIIDLGWLTLRCSKPLRDWRMLAERSGDQIALLPQPIM